MKYRKHFAEATLRQFDAESRSIIEDTDSRYHSISKDVGFAAHSTNPLDRRLDFAAYFLAFIQALEQRGLKYEEIKKICLEITAEFVRPKNVFQRWFKKLPPKFINTGLARSLINLLNRKVSVKGNADGFRAVITTDSGDTFGFGYGVDILECGICKLFAKHKADHYNTILCEVDKITSSMAGLELVRTGTIATGFKKCDFRYKKER
jgi:hypothetical protein